MSNVEVIPYGDHLHYEDMPMCEICEAQNDRWERVKEKYTTYELATKISKTKAYRAYRQAKPFDDFERPVSLDAMLEAGVSLSDESKTLEEDYADREEIEQFRQTLTRKQQSVMDRIVEGYGSKEIAEEKGYKSTGGVRYHKHAIRKKYRGFSSSVEGDEVEHPPKEG